MDFWKWQQEAFIDIRVTRLDYNIMTVYSPLLYKNSLYNGNNDWELTSAMKLISEELNRIPFISREISYLDYIYACL